MLACMCYGTESLDDCSLTFLVSRVSYSTMSRDLPGIIEGAADGRGRGRQVISTARTCNLILIVLDAGKPVTHKKIIEQELFSFGIRINQEVRACVDRFDTRVRRLEECTIVCSSQQLISSFAFVFLAAGGQVYQEGIRWYRLSRDGKADQGSECRSRTARLQGIQDQLRRNHFTRRHYCGSSKFTGRYLSVP